MRCFLFFFFKQKTAYEMRISDWSSDVCSSDLRERVLNLSFLSKAQAWEYEREWRILSERPGSLSVPLRLKGIYFGERCSRAIQTVIVKALHDAHPQLTFYRVRFDANTFELHRQEVDIDEEIHCGICPPVALSFRAVLKPVLPSG